MKVLIIKKTIKNSIYNIIQTKVIIINKSKMIMIIKMIILKL
jgi:hypothetical protein